jgi:D-alanyl-D-alanine carboxypeptidase (penicillin-binding protein 5/6)
MRVRLVAAAVAGCLAVAASAMTASAAPHSGSAQPIGGPLLASRGLIERPLAGAPALPPPSALPASSWMVSNLTTGQVLAAKDPHGKYLPASTLKMLTAVTLLPKLDPHALEPVSYQDATVDGSRVGLVPSMRYTVSKLFTCMLVVSANDAADTLADANGGIHHTVTQMNAEAHELQADDTFARTPSGLDGPGETTSAYDLSLIAQAGLKMPAFRHYIGTIRSTVPAPHHKHFAIYTHNELLTTYRGDIGVKNGYTVDAQGTYVGAATRGGQTILITLMHAYPNFWPMARLLLNWGFKANGRVEPVGNLVQPLPPPTPVATTQAAASNVVKGASIGGVHHHQLPWFPLEIAAAAIVALGIATMALRRRQRNRRNRYYRSRLRLPPM